MLPPPLSAGDTIAVVSPSRRITHDQMERSWQVFDEWGLNVLKGRHLFATDGYFAGSDQERLEEFQAFLDDSSVKAVFCARGGYGATRFVDRLNWKNSAATQKWIVGFSDITAIHLAATREGLGSVHGLMPAQYGYDGVDESLASLRDLLFYHTFTHELESNTGLTCEGSVIAPVTGGNLSLLAESLGTPAEIDTRGKILFMEEIDEYLYKIDRMLNQLARAGKFEGLEGVIIGDFSDCQDTKIPFGKDIYGILERYFAKLRIPVASGLPLGHEPYNLALPLNVPVHMEVKASACKLSLAHSS